MVWKRSESEAGLDQIRAVSRLGKSLRDARREAKLSQAALAASAGTSERSVWQAEAGQGRTDMFLAFASLVNREVGGRSLPSGEHLGARLAALRLRVGMSRRKLASVTGLSATTLKSLECGEVGHLSVVERVGDALGAGLSLLQIGTPSFFSTAALSSAWGAWATPSDILERLYGVIGRPDFDLDPCSPGRYRSRVRARSHYEQEDNGLAQPWQGVVYFNPPYGRGIGSWTAKARSEATGGRAQTVVGLLPARTDTGWWHRDVAGHADVWFLRGRLAFGDGSQPSPFASAVTIWRATEEHRVEMARRFQGAWHVRSSEQAIGGKSASPPIVVGSA